MPRVSIGMPVYDSRPDWFHDALSAVLGQTFDDLEVILSDNGSGEAAEAMYRDSAAKDSRIRYVRHAENKGAVFNYRASLDAATGEFFTWAADDDLRGLDFVRRSVAALDDSPGSISVGCRAVWIDGDGRQCGEANTDERFCQSSIPALRVYSLACPNPMMHFYGLHRTAVVKAIDWRNFTTDTDWQFVLQLLLRGPIARLPTADFYYRVRPVGADDLDYVLKKMLSASERASAAQQNKGSYRAAALSLLGATISTSAPLSLAERAAALAALTSALTWDGWFTADRLQEMRGAMAEAVHDRRPIEAVALAAEYLALSPTAPFRPTAWQRGYKVLERALGRQ